MRSLTAGGKPHGAPRKAIAPAGSLEAQVFRGFPNPVFVTGSNRRIVLTDTAFDAMFGERPYRSCCDVLDCHSHEAVGGRCLTELALSAGERLPEVRLDLPQGTSAWVLAAPLLDGSERVVFELRPALAGDRRRAERKLGHVARLSIACLGELRVEIAGRLELRPWIRQRPGQLLKLLVVNRGRVSPTDKIASMLWPQANRDSVGNVRYLVHALRVALEDGLRGASSLVLARGGGYMLSPSEVLIDADEFERATRRGLTLAHAGMKVAAVEALEQAAALYHGDLFADEPYLDFALTERNRLLDLAGRGLRATVELRRDLGEDEAVGSALRRLAELEPYDVDIQREVIADCLHHGRLGEASRRHAALRAGMMRIFGLELNFDLTDLSR